MKNNDVINEIKQDGWDIKKLINVNAKVAFYHGDSDDHIGIRVYLPKVVKDQVEKAMRVGNYKDREENNIIDPSIEFLLDGTTLVDIWFTFNKER